MVNVTPVPERLEDAVAQSESQDVLHRLFAQVVVDAVDLALVEDAEHVGVERLGAGEVAPEPR